MDQSDLSTAKAIGQDITFTIQFQEIHGEAIPFWSQIVKVQSDFNHANLQLELYHVENILTYQESVGWNPHQSQVSHHEIIVQSEFNAANACAFDATSIHHDQVIYRLLNGEFCAHQV